MNRINALSVVFGAVLACVPAALVNAADKTVIKTASDLPRFSYPVAGSASSLAEADDGTFKIFSDKVRADLDQVLNDYEIEDKSTLRELLAERLNLQELSDEYAGALQTIGTLRALEEKPALKLTAGLAARARIIAAQQVPDKGGTAYLDAFAHSYRQAIDPLPWDVVQERSKESYVQSRILTRAFILGIIKTNLDPAVEKSGALDAGEAAQLIAARNRLKNVIPTNAAAGNVLHTYIGSHTVTKPDIWAEREVTLSAQAHLPPVPVAIWDSGIDVSLFPGQIFDDAHPSKSGAHGMAFDDQGAVSPSWLYPLTATDAQAYPKMRSFIKGFVDVQNGIDSPDANSLIKTLNTASPDEMHALYKQLGTISHYIHGTHCAGIAARGNPAIRLVVARFNDELPEFEFPPTDAWVRRFAADFRAFSDYFRTRHVRVVNMSWSDEPQEFETWLSKTGGGADPAMRKQQAAQLYAIWRAGIEAAIKGAPNTLFVTAAGNSNNDPSFIESVPPVLHLPNLITVGAVDQAGDETSFTSHGDTVVVYADGYEVESSVPGGGKLKLSGTSMAAPNVVNLAAKLFALDPALTPADAIALIVDGSTVSSDGRFKLIDERKSVALLRAKFIER
jgi:hypothetical protein